MYVALFLVILAALGIWDALAGRTPAKEQTFARTLYDNGIPGPGRLDRLIQPHFKDGGVCRMQWWACPRVTCDFCWKILI